MWKVVPTLLAVALVMGACTDHGSEAPLPGVSVFGVFFEARVELESGVANGSDVALADLTGDGRPDLAAVDQAGSVRILVGQGGGRFAPGSSAPAPVGGSAVRASDLDGDGDVDLAVASALRDEVGILLNRGDGSFVVMPTLTTAPIPSSLAVEDCDDDLVPDVLVTHFSQSSVEVFLGNGDGTFRAPVGLAVPAAGNTAGLVVAEVTGDAHTDILIADSDRAQIVALAGSTGGLHDVTITFPTGVGPYGITTGDLTEDGLLDVVVTCAGDRTVRVYSFDGSNGFVELQRVEVGGVPGLVAVDDVTGDGVLDVMTCLSDAQVVSVLEGDTSGGALLGRETQIGTTGAPFRPIPADVDGDGRTDLLVSAAGQTVVNLFLGRAVGLSGARHWATPLDNPSIVDSADLDGDGTDEIVAAARLEDRVAVFRSGPRVDGSDDPELQVETTIAFGDPAQIGPRDILCLSATDVDRDGKVDIVTLMDEGVRVARNATSSGGALAFDVVPPPGQYFAGLVDPATLAIAEDVTGDGIPDLVVAYDRQPNNRLGIALGLGNAAFAAPATIDVVGTIGGLEAGDFDGDGRVEVAASLAFTAAVTFFDVDAQGMPTPAFIAPVGSLPTRLDTADFNRDGTDDLVVSNGTSDEVTILVATGGGAFQRVDAPVGRAPTALATDDLNRDGIPDILVTTLKGADFTVLLGDGSGGVTFALRFPGVYTANTATLSDLNGDGLEDLTIGGFETRRLAVYRNVSREL